MKSWLHSILVARSACGRNAARRRPAVQIRPAQHIGMIRRLLPDPASVTAAIYILMHTLCIKPISSEDGLESEEALINNTDYVLQGCNKPKEKP